MNKDTKTQLLEALELVKSGMVSLLKLYGACDEEVKERYEIKKANEAIAKAKGVNHDNN